MISLEYRLKIPQKFDEESCIISVEGDISVYQGDLDRELVIGYQRLGILRKDIAVNNGISVIDALDSISSEMYGYVNIFNKYGKLKKGFADEDEEIFDSNILILERLKICKFFHGLKLGYWATHQALEQFSSGCCLAILMACPLGDENSKESYMGYADRPWTKDNLSAYYEEFGFKKKAGFMILNPQEYLENEYPWSQLDYENIDSRIDDLLKEYPDGIEWDRR
jgi:hypothetical protein